jgi:hypothetical protein
MSHFYLNVLVPMATPVGAIDQMVNTLMEPYDESIVVEPYDHKCWCVGRQSYVEVQEQLAAHFAKERGGPKEKTGAMFSTLFRDPYWQMPEDDRPEWETWIKPWTDLEKKLTQAHKDRDKPDPKCGWNEEANDWHDDLDDCCKGTGTYKSTYNPKSQWDWWDYGGRWNREIHGDYKGDENGGFNFGDQYRRLSENMVTVPDLLERGRKPDQNIVPFAVLTPDGEWHQRGEMGWFGMVRNPEDAKEWKQRFGGILERHKDCYAIGIDCHI